MFCEIFKVLIFFIFTLILLCIQFLILTIFSILLSWTKWEYCKQYLIHFNSNQRISIQLYFREYQRIIDGCLSIGYNTKTIYMLYYISILHYYVKKTYHIETWRHFSHVTSEIKPLRLTSGQVQPICKWSCRLTFFSS